MSSLFFIYLEKDRREINTFRMRKSKLLTNIVTKCQWTEKAWNAMLLRCLTGTSCHGNDIALGNEFCDLMVTVLRWHPDKVRKVSCSVRILRENYSLNNSGTLTVTRISAYSKTNRRTPVWELLFSKCVLCDFVSFIGLGVRFVENLLLTERINKYRYWRHYTTRILLLRWNNFVLLAYNQKI